MKEQARHDRTFVKFWSRVRFAGINDCWPWKLKPRDPFGYGGFHFNNRTQLSHRVAWQLANGEIPIGLCVLHRCDNPPCVNPAHLFLGTKTDNARDRNAKGRTSKGHTSAIENRSRGAKNVNVKLTEDIIRLIRLERSSGATRTAITERFKVARSTIGRIVAGQVWGYVK